ncbi:putative PurR-regulated permease PerM [Palleronia aestuarii]|uniref:Putative PurR-regulated permease PerM n=1 Tax=Palleronia aestuarii TaxID=568105 RepID=A0A2W7N8C5_9RHOB|nr:AI-2E family transporter [Palleronia aestuarii]PZX14447.1 putative PurR-regulated permease PerM [Palleronia aestuarii]
MNDASDKLDTSDTSTLRQMRSIPRWAGIAIFIYATIYTLSYAKSFLVPVVLAFLLTLVFSPIRRVFDRRGIPSALTSALIVLGLLVVSTVILGTLAMPVAGWIDRAPMITEQIREQISEVSGALSGILEATKRLTELGAPGDDVERVVTAEGGYATDLATLIPGIVAQIVFTLVLLFFLLASGDMFYEKLVHVIPRFRDKRRAMTAMRDIERRLSRYLFTITVINVSLGICVGLAMWWLGMPSPAIFGMIAFLFNYVPYLGALAGIVVATAVALVSFDGIFLGCAVGGAYLALTSIEGQLITPYFVGRSLRLNTVVVFLAVSFWAWLWSAVGMVVAVPLLAALRTVAAHVDGMGAIADFLGERHSEVQDESEADTS